MPRADHPEATETEVCIGNMWACDFPRVGWKSKRMGKVSYDRDGRPIPTFRPVFVLRTEIEADDVEIPDVGPVDHKW